MKTSEVFKENLKKLRKKLQVSQEDFARKVELSVRGYQKYEQGESAPTPEILDRFARVLGCDPLELLSPEEKTPKAPDLASAGSLLSKLGSLEPRHLRVVMAILYKDASFVRELPTPLQATFSSLLKAL